MSPLVSECLISCFICVLCTSFATSDPATSIYCGTCLCWTMLLFAPQLRWRRRRKQEHGAQIGIEAVEETGASKLWSQQEHGAQIFALHAPVCSTASIISSLHCCLDPMHWLPHLKPHLYVISCWSLVRIWSISTMPAKFTPQPAGYVKLFLGLSGDETKQVQLQVALSICSDATNKWDEYGASRFG